MILAADLHIRKTRPRSRTDDYWAAQEAKFDFILHQAAQSPPLLVAGDFFDRPRPGEFLIRWVIEKLQYFNAQPVVVPGQHDLPYHSLDRIDDSGLGVLAAAGVIALLVSIPLKTGSSVIWGVPFGETPESVNWPQATDPNLGIDKKIQSVLLWHHMVIQEPLWPGQVADKAPAILRKYPQFDLIVTGDNHQAFIQGLQRINGLGERQTILVNPGSMMRMTSAQADHKPCVFKWEEGRLEQIFLPIKPAEEVLDLANIEKEKERDARIGAFVDRLQTGYEHSLSFERNLEEHFMANEVENEVKALVRESLEE